MTIYLPYSRYQNFLECPQKYLWSVEGREPSAPSDPKNLLLGVVWGRALENFYKQKKYLLGAAAREWMRASVEEAFLSFEGGQKVAWSSSQERGEMLRTALDTLPTIFEAVKKEKLLSRDSRAEFSMSAYLGHDLKLWGRVDLALLKEDGANLIDFKGTKHEDGHSVSETQALWYALLWTKTREEPLSKSGFWYLRFSKLVWVDISKDRLQALTEEIRKVGDQIRDRNFEATPSEKSCRWCPYRKSCAEREQFQQDFLDDLELVDLVGDTLV